MALKIGIIGLPNVGKSTLFNALTQTQNAAVANYPFCTIEPNRAVVPVPDPRLEALASLVKVEQIIQTTIEFLDIAGLVKGASQGEGLGNQFLETIRTTDALLHVVRCFEDPNVVHVSDQPDPREDIEVIQLELALADLEQVEKRLEKLSADTKAQKGTHPLLEMAVRIRAHLQANPSLQNFPDKKSPEFQALNNELHFLTIKPVIYIANLSEEDLAGGNDLLTALEAAAANQGATLISISALLEAELFGLSEKEKKEYLELAGVDSSGLEKVIRTGYEALDLISFFTYNQDQARAWTVKKGATAPEAAGRIHSDFQRGFIKAEVIPFADFQEFGSASAARNAGKLRVEGKDYIVEDGDVIYFRYNV